MLDSISIKYFYNGSKPGNEDMGSCYRISLKRLVEEEKEQVEEADCGPLVPTHLPATLCYTESASSQAAPEYYHCYLTGR